MKYSFIEWQSICRVLWHAAQLNIIKQKVYFDAIVREIEKDHKKVCG